MFGLCLWLALQQIQHWNWEVCHSDCLTGTTKARSNSIQELLDRTIISASCFGQVFRHRLATEPVTGIAQARTWGWQRRIGFAPRTFGLTLIERHAFSWELRSTVIRQLGSPSLGLQVLHHQVNERYRAQSRTGIPQSGCKKHTDDRTSRYKSSQTKRPMLFGFSWCNWQSH
jgi:hypothetical protein